jgi:hypothetical protein
VRAAAQVTTLLAAMAVASCAAPEGHRGPPIDGALRVELAPVHWRGSSTFGLSITTTNLSDEAIRIGGCDIFAFDRRNRLLFRLHRGFLRGGLLRPGQTVGDPGRADYQWTGGRWQRLDPADVHHYRVHCTSYRWMGRCPSSAETDAAPLLVARRPG